MEKAAVKLNNGIHFIIEIPYDEYEIEQYLLFSLDGEKIKIEFEKVSRNGYLFYKQVENNNTKLFSK